MLQVLGLSEPLLLGMAVAAVSALSFFVVFGAGQFNVSTPGFVAVGAYSSGLASLHGIPLPLGVAIGLVISAPLSLALVLVTQRLSGVYLAIATLAFVELVGEIIILTPSLQGPLGIYGIPISVTAASAWLIVFALGVLFYRLARSRLGMEMVLLREDVIVARGAGVNDLRVKVFAAVLSACVASLAGAMTALSTSYISPDEFGFPLLIAIMTAVIVGGSERYWGAVVGAVILTELPELSRVGSDYRPFLSGAILLAAILLAPEGIAGAVIRGGTRLRRRTERPADLATEGPGRVGL